jgi:hypothetical protein
VAAATKKEAADELLAVVTGRFVEEEGCEPPQGSFVQTNTDDEDGGGDDPPSSRLRIVKGRWQLSEDPNDRKDGLWVWGLFEEPLYPYMLLQLETDAIPLPNNSNNDDDVDGGDCIPPLRLYAQIDHRRDKERGAVLEGGASLNVREKETVRADIFGAANADVYEEKGVGTLSIQPVEAPSNKAVTK